MGYFQEKKACDPKWIAGDEEHDAALAESGVSVEAAGRMRPQPTRWLVQDVVPDEAMTLVAGEPGAGKTFLGCQLAADAARQLGERVVLATSGDESPELLRWRLEQAQGDARRVAIATLAPKGFTDRRRGPTDEEIDERVAILYHTLEAAGDPTSGLLPDEISLDRDRVGKAESSQARRVRLLVIDDVDGWFGKPGNMLSPAALARVIQRLNELARSKRVAIVALARLQLNVQGRITARQLSRLSHAASVVWAVVRDREQGRRDREQGETEERNPQSRTTNPRLTVLRWLLPVKNNLAADRETFGRAFELVEGRIQWRAGPVPELAEALLPSAATHERRRLRQAAVEWRQEALADGPLPSSEVYEQALNCGFSKGTMVRAVNEVGIRSHKTGFEGGWEMRWPASRQVDAPGQWEGGLRIVGAAEDDEEEQEGTVETERQGERREEAVGVAVNASCDSSATSCDSSAASCDSSATSCDSSAASCDSSAASCDSSAASCDSSAASCDSSATERLAGRSLESAPSENKGNNSLVEVLEAERKAC